MFGSVKGQWRFFGVLIVLTSGCSLFYPSDVTSYSNDIGVSYAEAQYRLSIQIELSLLNTELIKETENFGGLYIEHVPEYSINILYKDISSREKLDTFIADKSWAKKVKVRQVNYSLEELKAAQKNAGKVVTQLAIKYSSGIDIKQNLVKINVLNKNVLKEKLYSNTMTLPSPVKTFEIKAFSVLE